MKHHKWGKSSQKHLSTIHDDLVKVFTVALKEFAIYDVGMADSIRTVLEQKGMVESGASHTMKSRHVEAYALTKPVYPRKGNESGIVGLVSHAGDFGFYDKNGKLTEDIRYMYSWAECVQRAAIKLGIPVVWGGCWKRLNDIVCIHDEVEKYIARKTKQGKKAFLDFPHFHLCRTAYPSRRRK